MAQLGEICTVVSGSTPKTDHPEYWGGPHNWITPAELTEDVIVVSESQRKITEAGVRSCSLSPFPKGTVILSSRAPIGKTAIAGAEMYCNQGFKNLICSDRIYNRYLFWFLRSRTAYLNSLGRGATFKEISKKIVEEIDVPLVSMEEQVRIAQRFDKIFALLALHRRQLAKLDELVKSQFVGMFGLPGTDPYGWGLTTLGNCCELNPRRPQNMPADIEYSFVAMPSVSEDGFVDTSKVRPYSEVSKGFTYFAENDVLFAKITPCMENGKGGIAAELKNGAGFGSTEFHVLRPLKGKSSPHWLYVITSFQSFRMNAAKVMTGTGGQRRVPLSYLEDFLITLPPLDLQEQFSSFVQQRDKTKAAIRRSMERLETLQAALVQAAFG